MRAFVIRPFDKKRDSSGTIVDFEHVHNELIAPALKAVGLGGGTTGEIVDAGNIREDMFSLIIEADIVVADITVHNANVFYELGIRHALRKKRSVMIKGVPVTDGTPFDLLTDRYLAYEVANPAGALAKLIDTLRATLMSDRETDSPVFKMLPRLQEADPNALQVVPTDFAEELGRARAAKSRGWLRQLTQDLHARRFEWPALRLVAQAQLELRDYEGALASWQKVRENAPDDIAANLALANIYERLYKAALQPDLLECSNQAIARALQDERTTPKQRSEALGLKGRNLKTLWSREFEKLASVSERRHAAITSLLRSAYEAYRAAYLYDLNGYWPGLAALQHCAIAVDLATEPTWGDTFDNGEACKAELVRQSTALQPIVAQAVETAIARATSDEDRIWARISAADLRFLVDERPARVIQAYRDAIPRDNAFAWDAARGQLRLFSALGVKASLADEVIRTIEPLVAWPVPEPGLHTIVFVGHMIDEPGRTPPRFPAEREAQARALIREELQAAVAAGTRAVVLASASPGADIICHELCLELGVDSSICLPMPGKDYARCVFGDQDAWRSRYLSLAAKRPVLHLSDQQGLPRWLAGSGVDQWERGNCWVLQMAQTNGPAKVTLIALWDRGKGGPPGGTAHMVQIARDAGGIDVVIVDTAKLLA